MNSSIYPKSTEVIKTKTLEDPGVTVAVVTYNGINVIQHCLNSILAQSYQPCQIFVINNASTDDTSEWIQAHYPQVMVINLSENRGPNPARNVGILKTPDTNLTLLVDDDAILDKNCLSELLKAYQQYPDGAAWAPRIVYDDQPERIQYEGTFIHYTAEAVLLNSNQPTHQGLQEITPVHAANGTCFLVSKSAATAIGLFDEDYFFGRTDGEFTFRLTLSGYSLYTVPSAVCSHRVKKRGFSKVFYQIRNRWYFMLTTYSGRTLLLLLPPLMIYEMSLMAFLLIKGQIGEYFKAIIAVVKSLPQLWQKRHSIQQLKVVSDREVLCSDSMYMREDLLKNRTQAFLKSKLEEVFRLYWKFISPLI